MIDRTRALIAAAAISAVTLLAVTVGFVAGRATGDSSTESVGTQPSGEGLPAGPSRVEDGVPLGFARTEDGALAAAATWVPPLFSFPSSEKPAGISEVLSSSLGAEIDPTRDATQRLHYLPIAGRVSEFSASTARVDLLMWLVGGDVLGEQVYLELIEQPLQLEWDEAAEDWRIDEIPSADYVDAPFRADDAAGYRSLQPTGATLGGVLIEQVPGE